MFQLNQNFATNIAAMIECYNNIVTLGKYEKLKLKTCFDNSNKNHHHHSGIVKVTPLPLKGLCFDYFITSVHPPLTTYPHQNNQNINKIDTLAGFLSIYQLAEDVKI